MVAVRVVMEPAPTRVAAHFMPTAENASDSGACVSSSENGTMPVRTRETATYIVVAISSVEIMPTGKSRCGRFTSPARVDTADASMSRSARARAVGVHARTVKAHEAEKHNASRRHDARRAMWREGRPVGGVHLEGARHHDCSGPASKG